MSDLRKIHALQKKANLNNRQTIIEVDVITEDNPKASWDYETWQDYYRFNKERGNTVYLLVGEDLDDLYDSYDEEYDVNGFDEL